MACEMQAEMIHDMTDDGLSGTSKVTDMGGFDNHALARD
jgi:hypothetical protein